MVMMMMKLTTSYDRKASFYQQAIVLPTISVKVGVQGCHPYFYRICIELYEHFINKFLDILGFSAIHYKTQGELRKLLYGTKEIHG